MAQFILKINLGNDAMQTGYDIGTVLKSLASFLMIQGNVEYFLMNWDNVGYVPKGDHKIVDINGNTVGSWRVK